jgi:uncharacterized protein YndB with AHSA1/START domain
VGTFHVAVDIARTPAEVFALVAEPLDMAQWYDAVDHVAKASGGPTGAGARYLVTRSLPGGRARNEVEITEYEPDRRVTLASRSGPTPFRYRYTLDAIPTGTRLSLDGEISAAGVAGVPRVLDGAAAHLFRRGMQRNLRQLALLLEAS